MNIFIRIWFASTYFTVVLISKAKFYNPCHALKNGAAVQGLSNLKLILSQKMVSLILEKTDNTRSVPSFCSSTILSIQMFQS